MNVDSCGFATISGKLGHLLDCSSAQRCQHSHLNAARVISSHYPQLRSQIRRLYEVRCLAIRISGVRKAMPSGKFQMLRDQCTSLKSVIDSLTLTSGKIYFCRLSVWHPPSSSDISLNIVFAWNRSSFVSRQPCPPSSWQRRSFSGASPLWSKNWNIFSGVHHQKEDDKSELVHSVWSRILVPWNELHVLEIRPVHSWWKNSKLRREVFEACYYFETILDCSPCLCVPSFWNKLVQLKINFLLLSGLWLGY